MAHTIYRIRFYVQLFGYPFNYRTTYVEEKGDTELYLTMEKGYPAGNVLKAYHNSDRNGYGICHKNKFFYCTLEKFVSYYD